MREQAPPLSLVARLFDQVGQRPDKAAIIGTDGEIVRYQDLWQRVAVIARALSDAGVAAGDRVALWLDNSAHYAAAYYACLLAGVVVVPLNTSLKPKQIGDLLQHADAVAVLANSGDGHDFARLNETSSIPLPRLDVDILDGTPADLERAARAVKAKAHASDALASLIYTSGTTGRPKGVMLSEKNLAANTEAIIRYLELSASDTATCVLPFYYSYGNSVLHTHLAVGATLLLEDSFLFPHLVLERMQRHQVTGFSGVPATYALLLNRCKLEHYPLPSLRYATQAGGPMPADAVRAIAAAWPQARFFCMYGQTEATARLTWLPPERLGDKLGSVGIAIPGVEIAIMDADGREPPPGELGEICARGPNIMLGYWKDAAATADKFRDGWLRTGDLGRRDDDGFITIAGRSSEIIKTGAHRVAPEEIESVIVALDGVLEAAVCGMPDPLLGEVIKAFIVKRDGTDLSTRMVLAHCNVHLAKYKLPKQVEFVATLPKTASGKIQRYKLAAGEW